MDHELNRSSLAGLRILLAEDDYLIAMEMDATLESLGCTIVGPARTVQEVENFAAVAALDGALLDVNLRGETIDRVMPALIARGVKIVLSTGYEDKLLAARFPGIAVITKPYTEDDLRAVCQRVFLPAR